jgi:hypothetical protein
VADDDTTDDDFGGVTGRDGAVGDEDGESRLLTRN